MASASSSKDVHAERRALYLLEDAISLNTEPISSPCIELAVPSSKLQVGDNDPEATVDNCKAILMTRETLINMTASKSSIKHYKVSKII